MGEILARNEDILKTLIKHEKLHTQLTNFSIDSTRSNFRLAIGSAMNYKK